MKLFQPASHLEALYPTEDVYIYRNGHRLHYQVAGAPDAPALVLLHGIGGNVNWWQMNMPAFSRHFRTYALDLPGFGFSWRLRKPFSIEEGAHYLREWLDFLGLGQVHLLGHSMGGHIAARFASRHPHRLSKLVLAAPSGLWVTTRQRLTWLRDMPRVSVPLNQTLSIATGTMKTDLITLGISLKAILGDRGAAAALAALTMPTLLLWGGSDGVLPPSLGERALQLLQKAPARLEYIVGGTHNMMYDQAEQFNRQTLDFLLETAPVSLQVYSKSLS
ncbi:MAG: alpha/beta hydrolase [Chloroflexi bacterium]|nr:alpha/beta hydrolase [Chloroflexota bacterium]